MTCTPQTLFQTCLVERFKRKTFKESNAKYCNGLRKYFFLGSTDNPLVGAFLEAGTQAGYKFTSDLNGYRQEGFGIMDMTIYKGKRWSTASAYLRPALSRPNLTTKVRFWVIFVSVTLAVIALQSKDLEIDVMKPVVLRH